MTNRAQASSEFAQWLGEVHPEVYEAVFARAIASGANTKRMNGFGFFGDDSDLGADFSDVTSDFTPDVSEPALQDISVDTGNVDYVIGSSMGDAADALPIFAPISSAQAPAGGVTGSANTVGQWITSAAGVSAVVNLGTAVLNTVATVDAAKTQMAVIQAQAARAQTGQSPYPISYVTNAAGQLVPVYNTSPTSVLPTAISNAIGSGGAVPINNGTAYALSSNTLSSLFSGNSSLLLLLGGAALLLLLLTEKG